MPRLTTITILAIKCQLCNETFSRSDWKYENYKKIDTFGKYRIWDTRHLCFNCYKNIHRNDTDKDMWINRSVAPRVKVLVHGYECSECKTPFTVHDWECEQDEKDDINSDTDDLCYYCYENEYEMRNN